MGLLRILQQCLYYPPEVGGLESHVSSLSAGLAARGHQVAMLTSRSRPGLARREVIDGVDVHRTWMPGRNPVGWAAHAAVAMPRHLRLSGAADLFHAHTFACGLSPVVSRWLHRRPYVLTLHTSHFLMRADKPLWRMAFRRIISAADYLLATSDEIMEVARSIYDHPQYEVVTNAVDTGQFTPAASPQEPPVIIVPRRLFEKNGVEYFVRALPDILARRDVRAWIVGDGPERGKLERLARELDVARVVAFKGARPHHEMPELLRRASIAVIPSLMEARSVAALEAMASGLPVAASRVGGLPEIIDEQVGVLFEPADPPDLARAVVELLSRPDLAQLGEEARGRVMARWSVEHLVDRHLEIYDRLLNGAE